MFDHKVENVKVIDKPRLSVNGAFGEIIMEFSDSDTKTDYKVTFDADYSDYLMEGAFWAKNKASDKPTDLGYQEFLNEIDLKLQAMCGRYWFLSDNLIGHKDVVYYNHSLKDGYYLVKSPPGEETLVTGPFAVPSGSVFSTGPKVDTPKLGWLSGFFYYLGL